MNHNYMQQHGRILQIVKQKCPTQKNIVPFIRSSEASKTSIKERT